MLQIPKMRELVQIQHTIDREYAIAIGLEQRHVGDHPIVVAADRRLAIELDDSVGHDAGILVLQADGGDHDQRLESSGDLVWPAGWQLRAKASGLTIRPSSSANGPDSTRASERGARPP